MENNQRQLTLDENFEMLGLADWASEALTDDQRERLQQLLLKEGGVQNVSQARFLFELTRLVQPHDIELARLLADRALDAAHDEAAWLDSEPNGLGSKYWGYEAFLEARYDLRHGSPEDQEYYYKVAEKQVQLGAEYAEVLNQHQAGPSDYHRHAGYYYLARKAAEEGDSDRATQLINDAEAEGWRGDWDELREQYGLG